MVQLLSEGMIVAVCLEQAVFFFRCKAASEGQLLVICLSLVKSIPMREGKGRLYYFRLKVRVDRHIFPSFLADNHVRGSCFIPVSSDFFHKAWTERSILGGCEGTTTVKVWIGTVIQVTGSRLGPTINRSWRATDAVKGIWNFSDQRLGAETNAGLNYRHRRKLKLVWESHRGKRFPH